ncbi:Putative AAA domain-containing protein [Tolypocladium paradoxum]|uniref:AAA domain-containing protein n=1 Tax=Tolypocladium paradoxum TaxID=94208 RepID=A0A2S4L356_9HYPO|nr:Putative AAA domain-containing protein [Tolypocladium paradoxum]
MLRNKAFTVLQKTYDDSYLSCSTAVYYEGQGDELEAMRHWRNALDHIYEHHATKAIPGYGPQTDTEKALVEALKELELQCKERIDLLEALRVSRQDGTATSPSSARLSKAPELHDSMSRTKGCIGQGTIPAVTYSQLSRPSLPNRPSLPARTSSENAIVSGPSPGIDPLSSVSPMPGSHSPKLPPRQDKAVRSPSPEKHTMRTTLRSSRAGDKASKPTRKSPRPVAEGPNKAATLAWSALGSRERLLRGPSADSGPSTSTPAPRKLSDQLPKSGPSQLQWDSHSRRLVTQRDPESVSNGLQSTGSPRHSDDYSYSRPSLLSVSAASSALNSSSYHDASSSDQPPSRSECGPPPRTTPVPGPPSRPPKDEQANGAGTADDSGELSEKRGPSNVPARRKAVAKRPAQVPQPGSVAPDQERASRARRRERQKPRQLSVSSTSEDDATNSASRLRPTKRKEASMKSAPHAASSDETAGEESSTDAAWKKKQASILKNLPPGVDEAAAKQILNDIIVQGDEVHWGDIAGLEIAKNALRETVVYPFLRPDLFMGLREPARGMLLFGPPGTGKTMLARAVATESKSTFFSISASSLTSKYLGESEKLVRALFGLARALAPSIIFVDEIDSLLSQRSGSGEHEATRRIKTEFLIQWSDLQRAAAGRETTERDKERGDANRVLVLAATNLPWAIDEAARRRFVRRQYIPLPEPHTRESQLQTLLGQQKHSLSSADVQRLVKLTEGFSGSDITALAKDAAMGPLRSLGEALLHMTMDEIRPIMLVDFEASLGMIRPSVSKSGLKEYEDWAKEFGERGG